MFFLFALLASVGYALNNTLMASCYRRIDRLEAVTMRGVGLTITMIPFLFFTNFVVALKAPNFAATILVAAIFALFANWLAAISYSSLPVGIASALTMSMAAIWYSIFGYLILGEMITPLQIFWILMIIIGICALGAQKLDSINANYSILKGALAGFAYGILIGFAGTLIAKLARLVDPLAAGYFWESTIMLVGIVSLSIRARLLRKHIFTSQLSDLKKIISYSTAGAIGTGCFSIAMSRGPLGIISAVLAIMMVYSSIFAWWLYGEKLTKIQILLMVFILFMLIGLKIFAT